MADHAQTLEEELAQTGCLPKAETVTFQRMLYPMDPLRTYRKRSLKPVVTRSAALRHWLRLRKP